MAETFTRPFEAQDFTLRVGGVLVENLTQFSAGSSSPVAKLPVFGRTRAWVVAGDDEETYSAGGYLSNDPGQTALRAAARTRTPVEITVNFSDGASFTQEVLVTAREFSVGRNDEFQAITFTFEGVGEPTGTTIL